MNLADRCAPNFTSSVRSKGQDYLERGLVFLEVQQPRLVMARVQGSDFYEVTLRVDGGELWTSCSCPHFIDGYLCKHIWAVILATDGKSPPLNLPEDKMINVIWDPAEEIYPKGEPEDKPEDKIDDATQMAAVVDIQRLFSPKAQPGNDWQASLQRIERETPARLAHTQPAQERGKRVHYLLDLQAARQKGEVCLHLFAQASLQKGGWGKIKPMKVSRQDGKRPFLEEDRQILNLLTGIQPQEGYDAYYSFRSIRYSRVLITPELDDVIFPKLSGTGRLGWIPTKEQNTDIHPLSWSGDGEGPWRFEMQMQREEADRRWRLWGSIRRGETVVDLKEPLLFLERGLIIFEDRIARLDHQNQFAWIVQLRDKGPLLIPFEEEDLFLERLFTLPSPPPLELPPGLQWKEASPDPTPLLVILGKDASLKTLMGGQIFFLYDTLRIAQNDARSLWIDAPEKRLIRRSPEKEREALAQLEERGYQILPPSFRREDVFLEREKLGSLVRQLIQKGWRVEAEGKPLRSLNRFDIGISSGVDWFDLNAEVSFEGYTTSLPRLLAAARNNSGFVELGDGSFGMLPEDWLARFAPLARLGEAKDGKIRFTHPQAALLDVFLEDTGPLQTDEGFEKFRKKLRSFRGIEPAGEPPSFQGTLRDYQRLGLGWLNFLKEFGLGGCLADDMGLGKTIQVLALLESIRVSGNGGNGNKLPSLAVVPRSLVYNWIEEARRFTPELRMLDYTGLERKEKRQDFSHYDLIVTTYGTLRMDIDFLKDYHFELVILDEAQGIKNADSLSAKASRLLTGRQRLAMTGTPIENHLGELWSLFEFLNPGLLGRSSRIWSEAFVNRSVDPETLGLLSRALRPFLLRRTKEQVLKELPQKTEQTIHCELNGPQRALYDELRKHYQFSLKREIKERGLNRSKIQVLEAILRLRQAACHPGLIDKNRKKEDSAKIDSLLENLEEILEGGHKALVFSQFTSFLDLIRRRLDERKWRYEYLDGQTRDRKERVERFQTDPGCPLFLLSLKAGGLGLNLTAADYCFLMDPWWNPAVEAQAIDRSHRIGQTRKVFAYRLIAKDTIEEKILELQKGKKRLAEAVISNDPSFLQSISMEDIEWLLS